MLCLETKQCAANPAHPELIIAIQSRKRVKYAPVPGGVSSSLTLPHAAACAAGAFVVF
jgi:hypothetical protein